MVSLTCFSFFFCQDVQATLESLDSRISEVGSTAIRIGKGNALTFLLAWTRGGTEWRKSLTNMYATRSLHSAIGEKLETADKQRARAVLSKQLMEYFMQFNEGQCPTLESLMMQQGLEGQIEVRRRRNDVKLG